jgi:hypothetical protein
MPEKFTGQAGGAVMFSVYRFSPSTRIEMIGTTPDYPESVESEVERLWHSLASSRAGAQFDGNIVSAVEVAPDILRVRTVPYRYFAAQNARPGLFDALSVRPLAVSGLLECAEGIVFGKRAPTLMQHGGKWELVPSGAIDAARADESGAIDYRAQIMTELREEVGLDAEAVSSLRPFCLIDDGASHVLDIGIAIKSSKTGDQIRRAHQDSATQEYDALRIIPAGAVNRFVEHERSQMVGASEVLVRRYYGVEGE